MPDQLTTTLDSLKSFWNQLLHFLPQLLVAFLLLIVGWLVAKLLRKGLIKLLRMIHVDVAAEKAGGFIFL